MAGENETKMAVIEDSTVVAEVSQDENLPFVLQCNKCNSIFGDSFSWVCAKKELDSVSLSVVRKDSVISSEELETSTHGQDLGSTFSNLKCKSCNLSLGRVYKTTPKELDELRNIFTFYAAQIKCYQLGPKEVSRRADVEEMFQIPTTATLQHEILKLKAFVVAMSEKLQAIEDCCGGHPAEMRSDTTEHSGRQTSNYKDSAYESDTKTKRTFAEMAQNNGTKGRDTGKRKKT